MERKLSTQESLEIITSMISQTKQKISKGDSFYLLFWGWVISLSNFGHYILEKIDYLYPFIVWISVIPATIITFWYGFQQSKKTPVKTYLDRVYKQVWIAVFIAIIIVLAFMAQLNWHHNPVILTLAGIGTYVTGTILRFKPIIFGAVALWVGAIIAFLLPVTEQYLVGGIFIVLGYLIPGYMVKREEKNGLQTA